MNDLTNVVQLGLSKSLAESRLRSCIERKAVVQWGADFIASAVHHGIAVDDALSVMMTGVVRSDPVRGFVGGDWVFDIVGNIQGYHSLAVVKVVLQSNSVIALNLTWA